MARIVEETDPSTRGENVGMGADGTPTKDIDRRAEERAIKILTEKTDHDILSEEEGILEGSGEGTMIIDPIDGTRNSLLSLPFYCISLAYTPGDLSDVEVGYVRNLITGREYFAEAGEGAYRGQREKETEHRLKKEEEDIDEKELTFALYLGKKSIPETSRLARLPRRVRCLGSAALEICRVADDTFDLYYQRSIDKEKSLRITDIAASTLILREAGGEVYDGDWEPINMSLDPAERKDVIAIKNPRIKEFVIR